MVTFDDVEASIIIEREVQGESVPLPLAIRKANEKSVTEICLEIKHRASQ